VLAGRPAAGVELRFSFPVAPLVAVLVGIGLVETIRWLTAAARAGCRLRHGT